MTTAALINRKIEFYRKRLAMLEIALEQELAFDVSKRSSQYIILLNREWSIYTFALSEALEIEVDLAGQNLE